MKTLAVVGAGPGVGMAVAERFGREGFRVALLARSRDKLEGCVAKLERAGIEAAAFPADVLDRPGLARALQQVRSAFGGVDVLEYSPTPTPDTLCTPRHITVESAQLQFEYGVLGAIEAVRAVLPGMLSRGDGALLFTSAASAKMPVPFSSNFAIAAAGVRSYAYTLHQDLAPQGIYAGIVLIAGLIDKASAPDPSRKATPANDKGLSLIPAREIGDLFWDLTCKRDRIEAIAGDMRAVERLAGVSAGGA